MTREQMAKQLRDIGRYGIPQARTKRDRLLLQRQLTAIAAFLDEEQAAIERFLLAKD